MKRAFGVLVLLLLSIPAFAQNPIVNRAPDCVYQFAFAASTTPPTPGLSLAPGTAPAFDNSVLACTTWTLTYQNSGFSALSIEFDAGTDISGTAGIFSTWPTASLYSGSLPLTSITYGQISGFTFAPWLQVKVNSITGSGLITGVLIGWHNTGDSSNGSGGAVNLLGQPISVTGTLDTPCYVKGGTGTVNDPTNHANCKSTAAIFKGVRAVNTSATLAYVRLYNLATDATCNSATGFVESIPIPASTTGAGIVDLLSNFASSYTTGLAYCVTGAGANNDNSAPPAGVYITLAYD